MDDELRRLEESNDIADDDVIFRRARLVMLGDLDAVKDGQPVYPPGEVVPIHRNFFSDYSAKAAMDLGFEGPCMSVGLLSVLNKEKGKPKDMLDGYPEDGLLRISVGDLRKLETMLGKSSPQGVMRAPTAAEPWHAVVFNVGGPPRTKPAKQAMCAVASWEIELRR